MKIMHDDKKIRGIIAAVDDLETEKATLSDVETLLASGDVEDIKADSIIENMTGYSFLPQAKTNITITNVYVGAVKTGNKLTIVNFGKVNRSDDVAYDFIPVGKLIIPQEVANKLIPSTLGNLDTVLIASKTSFFTSPGGATKDLNFVGSKETQGGNPCITSYIYGVNSLTANTEYQYRLEMTFLLSENLVPEE